MSWQSFGLVRVPFPFTDRLTSKRRPALVLSTLGFQNDSDHLHLAMVTSATHSHWSSDWPIEDLKAAGLPIPCFVRFKLFTLDQRLLFGSLGSLATVDRQGVQDRLTQIIASNPSTP